MQIIANPYSIRMDEFPDLIVSPKGKELTPEQIVQIRERCRAYSEVFVELGSGSGEHLIVKALNNPKALFIGFEIRFKRTFRTAEKAIVQKVDNILIVRTFAQELPRIFNAGTIDGFYVNFPDPWAKKHWLKHRLLTDEMIEQIQKVLKPKGFFSYKTDHEEYFKAVETYLKSSTEWKITQVTNNLHKSQFLSDNVPTEFEKLFLTKGLPIYFIKLSKISESAKVAYNGGSF